MFPSMWTHFDFTPTIEFDFVGEVLQPFVFANFQPVHAPNVSRPASQASGKQSCWPAPQGAFKNRAASSPRLVSGTAFYGDEPSPPLFTHFLERALGAPREANLETGFNSRCTAAACV